MDQLEKSDEQSKKLVQMVNEYSSLLYRTAYIYCKNKMDAEEIVQETYLKYLNKKPCFESKQHEKAWFLRVTINLCKDYLRCFWNRCTERYEDHVSYEMDQSWMLLDMIQKLPEKYRLVIQLYYIEGYETAEIAHTIKKTESAVRTRLSRAKNMLKEMGVREHG